ncbi:MAG: S8 family serine peptidase [Chloroflexota bacterium]
MRGKRFVVGLALCALLLVSALPGTGLLSSAAVAAPGRPDCVYAEDGACAPGPITPEQLGSRRQAQSTSAPARERVLVKRSAKVSPGDFKATLDKEGLVGAEGLLVPGWWAVPVPPGRDADDVLAQLKRLPDTVIAERELQRTVFATPNDPYFSAYQWGPQQIGAPAAWDSTYGSSDVLLAVIDTGIDTTHPDRPARLLLGRDFVNNDLDPTDDHGHGTHVAGIAGAATNNGIGIAGICPGCTVLVVKVMAANGSGSDADIGDGIKYAADVGVDQGKRTVINLSIGGDYSFYEANAVAYAQGKGALVVAAAGNGGHIDPSYPARLPGVIPVAATDASDLVAWFSQFAPLGLAAPGSSIYSTAPAYPTTMWKTGTPGYEWLSGTSMASPHVAGAAGLVWSQFPALTPSQVVAELKGAVDVPSGWNANYGAGRLNVDSAILRFTTVDLPAPVQWAGYNTTLDARGGTKAKSFTLVGGALPSGIRLTSKGEIVGIPVEAGPFSFVVRVADCIGEVAERAFSFTVAEAPPTGGPFRLYLPLVNSTGSPVLDPCSLAP